MGRADWGMVEYKEQREHCLKHSEAWQLSGGKSVQRKTCCSRAITKQGQVTRGQVINNRTTERTEHSSATGTLNWPKRTNNRGK